MKCSRMFSQIDEYRRTCHKLVSYFYIETIPQYFFFCFVCIQEKKRGATNFHVYLLSNIRIEFASYLKTIIFHPFNNATLVQTFQNATKTLSRNGNVIYM